MLLYKLVALEFTTFPPSSCPSSLAWSSQVGLQNFLVITGVWVKFVDIEKFVIATTTVHLTVKFFPLIIFLYFHQH
jgi:hypothetical protein